MHAAAAVRTFATTVFTPILRRILPLVVLLAAAGYGGSIAGSGDARAEWFKPLGTYPGCGYVAALNGNYCDTVADSCEAIATYRRGRLTGMAQNTGSVTCQLADASVDWDVTRPTCPAGSVIDVDEMSGCKATTNLVSNAGCLAAGEPGKSPSHGGQAAAGDPIDVINGNSHQCETDYRSAGPDVLEFKRHYNSRSWDKGSLGKGWSHSFSPWLQVGISHLARIYPRRPHGMIETFGNSLGRNPWHPKDTRMTGKLYEYGWGYTYTTLDGTVESYDTRGKLLNIVRRNGYTQTMAYDGAGNLIGVTDSHGRSLSFTYGAAGRMTAMIDPDGRITAYDYATVYTRTGLSFRTNNHGKVIYPDADDDALGAADVLFTRLDGPDGATAATDESASAHPLNFVGAAQIDTAQSRFGGASALFDGTATTYISAPDSADWHFGAGAFTVEAWVRFSSAAYMTLIKQFDSTGDQRSWAIDWTTDNQIRLRYSPDGTDAARVTLAAGWAPTPGAWHHIAVDRDSGSNLRIYADGKVLLNTVVTAAFHESTADLQIGRVHNGWIDDVRITKGEARYGGAWPAAASRANNPFKTYLYEDPNHFAALTGIVDETGVRTNSWSYRADVAAATTSTEAGGTNRAEIDFSAWPVRPVTGALGRTYDYTVAASGNWNAVSKIDRLAPGGAVEATRSFGYNGNGHMTSATDWNGVQTTWGRDARGLPAFRTEAVGTQEQQTTGFTWHPTLALPTRIVAPGLTADLDYDPAGLLTRVTGTDTTTHTVPYSTSGETRTTVFTYNADGLLESVDGPLPGAVDVTGFTYDASGYLDTVTNAAGHVMEVAAKDASGRPLRVLDPNGVRTDFAYDARGRVTEITADATGTPRTTTITYDDAGRVTATEAPGGDVLTYEYDSGDRLWAIVNGEGERAEFTYDDMGNRTATRVKASGGAVVREASATFDTLGRMLKSIGAYAGEETVYGYDDNGNVTSVTDPLGNVTGFAFDALNRLVTATDAASGLATLAYDSADNLDSATDQRSLATGFVHNGFGDVLQYASPDSGTEVYRYDAAGNLIERTDARGVVTEWSYDALGRPTAMRFPAAPAEDVTYTYDDATPGHYGIGRLASYADESGSTAYRYDAQGNIVHETRVIGTQTYVTQYAWDADGLLIEKTWPSGRIVTYARNASGEVTAVTTRASAVAPAVTIASGIGYEPFGPVNALTFGNGVTLALAYDLDGRLAAMDAFDGANPVLDLDYSHDLAGNITGIADAGGGHRGRGYTYDSLHRLTQGKELAPGGGSVALQTDYTYDGVGNRLTRTAGGAAETYTYDTASNRLVSVLGGGVAREFTYGDSGNVTLDERAGAATTLVYNAMDRLVRVESGAAVLAEYTYAATGQRAAKNVAGAVTHYLYDPGGALYAETDGAGTVLREYITLGGATIAIIDAGGVAYVHNDHLATPQAMTDGTAAVVWDASYRPFGEASIAGLAANAQRFPGQTADEETGYHDNWHRTYDPSLGRYLQSDPIGLVAGFNTYAYAHGNPVMYADPTGEIVPFLIWGLMAMQAAVAAIEFGVTFYYATETLLAIYERYQAGCEVGDLVGAWDLLALMPVLRYVRMAGRLARSGKAPGNFFGRFLADESGSVPLPRRGAPIIGVVPYRVGSYSDLAKAARGTGLDAHHVGQKAAMRNHIRGYDPSTAPAILVPKLGHTIRGPNGIVSRNTNGLENARQVLARDIRELRRLYPDIPNSRMRELIELNKKMYKEVR